MSPRILLLWYLKPWCIKTFPPRLPDINLAGMIANFIYEGGRLIRLFMPKLGMASVNHDRNSLMSKCHKNCYMQIHWHVSASVSSERISVVTDRCHTQFGHKKANQTQKLTRVNVSACNNFYDILTLTILGNEKKISADSYIYHFFQFLDHLNRRLIWAHLASPRCKTINLTLILILPVYISHHDVHVYQISWWYDHIFIKL
jgi:hypothetical protein